MHTTFTSLRALDTSSNGGTSPASTAATGPHVASAAAEAQPHGPGGTSASVLDALPKSPLEKLMADARPAGQNAPAVAVPLAAKFNFRELTLHLGAFAMAAPKAPLPKMPAGPAEKLGHLGNLGNLGNGLGQLVDVRGEKLGGERFGGLGDLGGLGGFGGNGGPGFKLPGGVGPIGPDVDPRANFGDGGGLGEQLGLGGLGSKLPKGLNPGGFQLPGGVIPRDPDLDPRANIDDGDGRGTRPGRLGPRLPGGGDPVPGGGGGPNGGLGFDGFNAYDIDLPNMPQYRDPDLDPRAQVENCGNSDCGTTTSDCGTTGGGGCGTTTSDCGTTGGGGCGTTTSDCGTTGGGGCGTTTIDCGTTGGGGCGTTTSDCGTTGGGGCGTTTIDCGTTGATGCGTTSGSFDPYAQFSRVDSLRQQLATQLSIANTKFAQ